MSDFARFLLLITSSFGITCALYWYVVRPFNVTRVIFGMKPLPRTKKQSAAVENLELIPRLESDRKASGW